MRDFIRTALSTQAFERYLTDPARVLLVDDPGAGAPFGGYAMVVLGEPADSDAAAAVRIRPTAELSKIYLLANQHGRGAAAALMERALDEAAGRGARGVWLGTNQQNARALRFYEKHAFTIVGRKRFKLGDTYEDDLVLERPLA